MDREILEQDKPKLAQFLKSLHFTEERIGDLIVTVDKFDQYALKVIIELVNENEELINRWIPDNAETMASVN